MDFAYTPRLVELKRRAAELTERIMVHEDACELHINLIRHGRAICRPRPRCRECGLRRMCPWYREHKADPRGNMLPRQ